MRAAVLRGTAGSLLLTAVLAAPAGAAGAVPARPQDPPPVPAALGTLVAAGRAAEKGIRFGPCPAAEALPGTVRCGTLSVPVDYTRPAGRHLTLTVSRMPATGRAADGRRTARQGTLVVAAGSAGTSGTYAPLAGYLPGWRPLAAAYDLVGHTPRGTDRSAPLSCADPATAGPGPAAAPAHPSEAFKRERIAAAKAYARGCARRGGPALRHLTSLNNARDLEVLRAALGERRLTYLGSSYGAYVGALYATLFPARVRRMVFDSAADPAPARVGYRGELDRSAAAEVRWADFRAWIARHDQVYGLGDTAEAVGRSYERAREMLAAEPAGGTVGQARLQRAMLQAVHDDDLWPYRAGALASYLRGDPTELVQQAGPYPETAAAEENGRAVETAVACNDAAWPGDWRVWDRDLTRLARTAPFAAWAGAWTRLPCAYWPLPRSRPPAVRTAPGALPPTLVLAAERDAAAPHRGARELRRRLAGSVLVTERDAGSHALAGGPNACVNAHLEAYLLRGRLPERDASCAGRPGPVPVEPGARSLTERAS